MPGRFVDGDVGAAGEWCQVLCLRDKAVPLSFGSRLGLPALRDAVWFREVSTCQSYQDGVGLLDIMDDGLPRRGSIPAANGINNGPVQGFQAHFLTPRSYRTRHVIGEPPSAFEHAPFHPQEFTVVGHAGQPQVELRICLSPVVVAVA